MIKIIAFVMFITIVIIVTKQQNPNSNHAPREYTIIVYKDTTWVMSGSIEIGKLTRGITSLDSFLKLDNPILSTDSVDIVNNQN